MVSCGRSRPAVAVHDQRVARSDLNMLIGTGGRERTQAGYEAMLKAAGLHPGKMVSLCDGYSVYETVCTTHRRLEEGLITIGACVTGAPLHRAWDAAAGRSLSPGMGTSKSVGKVGLCSRK